MQVPSPIPKRWATRYWYVLPIIAAVLAVSVLHWMDSEKGWRSWIFVLLAAYMPSYLDGSEHTGERYWHAFASSPRMRMLYRYFPARVRRVAAKKKGQQHAIDFSGQFLFASFPHGAMCLHHGLICTNAAGFFDISPGPRRRDIAANIIFKLPLYREVCLWCGCISSSRAVAGKVLEAGLSIGVLPGGMNEQLLASAEPTQKVYVKRRKGFVRLAMRYGVPIVPMYCFGENDLYHTSRRFWPFRQWVLRRFRTALPFCWGDSRILPLLPRRLPLTLCVGDPIPVPSPTRAGTEPDPSDVDRVHREFMDALVHIFESNKKDLGYAHASLHFV